MAESPSTPTETDSSGGHPHVVFENDSLRYTKVGGDVSEAHVTGSSQTSVPDPDKLSNGSSRKNNMPMMFPDLPTGPMILPECWSRLYTYVQYYTTVPDFKTVSKKTSKMPTILEEEGKAGVKESKNKEQKFMTDKDLLASMNTYGNLTLPEVHFLDESARSGKNSKQKTAIEKIAYPWLRGQRVPYVVFVTGKVREMNMSAALSELKLNANVRNIQGSLSMNKVLCGHGNFTDKSINYSISAHCDDCKIRLLEGIKPNQMLVPVRILKLIFSEVACMQVGRSHVMISCTLGRHQEKNALMTELGRVVVRLPHHPVQLHGVVQRQAKRISHSMSDFAAETPQVPAPTSECSSQMSSAQNTQRGSGSAHGKDSSYSSAEGKTAKKVRPKLDIATEPSEKPTKTKESAAPVCINLTAIAQGMTLDVALHPGLNAVYKVDPVYVIGKVGSACQVDISLTHHSLSFESSFSQAKTSAIPQDVCLPLPKILTSITQRKSVSGVHSQDKFQLLQGFRSGPMSTSFPEMPMKSKAPMSKDEETILTQGLTATEGTYLDIQTSMGMLEQTLSTDMLNYIVVVAKLFAREVNEIIQKMAGDEPLFDRGGGSKATFAFDLGGKNSLVAPSSRSKISLKIRQQGVRLMATTENGAIKLETKEIDVEFTNRVSPSAAMMKQASSNDSWVLFVTFEFLSLELGHLIKDIYYEERSPEFKTLAFFQTAIALRSLFAEEVTTQTSSSATSKSDVSEREAFLISLRRPIFCLKPAALDRAILLMIDYKKELAKWKERLNLLLAMASTANVTRAAGQRQNAQRPSVVYPADSSSDTGMALVLTLDKSRISACYKDSLVSEGEFTDFCLRFEDDFLIGSDDWQPDRKKNSFLVKDNRSTQLMIMNACTVPKGTFIVCSKAPDLLSMSDRSSWMIAVQWQMCGLDVHMDSSIGRRLKTLTSTLTDMTGYYDDHATALYATTNTDVDSDYQDEEAKDSTYDTKHLRGLERESRVEEFQKALECQSIKRQRWNDIKNKTNLISSVKRVSSLKARKPAGLEEPQRSKHSKSQHHTRLVSHEAPTARSTTSIMIEAQMAAKRQLEVDDTNALFSTLSTNSLNES
ncbi:hypothetical protein Ciccas_003114 [Cichlidogyrus casuarinus]|uniref:Fragile site-associated protein C-terminal domain-containing protein n=1 Tax=Cichlidogyrus casuarinus TaxID=1844966 RepID=A0ABD2QFR2_9PLAT